MIRFKQAYARKALPFLTGAIVVSIFATLQNTFVTGVPFHFRNYLVPVLIGGICGFLLGKAFFKLRESEVRIKTILDCMHSGIMVIDAETHVITEINKIALQMIGSSREDVIGSVCHKVVCTAAFGECPITDKGQEVDNSERVLLAANGEEVPIIKTVTTVYLGDRKHLLESFIDISERKKAEHKINRLAFYDTLTGLPNRTLLYERLDFALIQADRNKHLVGVMFIDLDRFKGINDTLGHSHGDQLLRVVSERLMNSVRKSDVVARLGGDEFVIIFDLVHEETITTIAQKILRKLAEPVLLGAQEVVNTCSIGIALYPMDGNNADTLLKNADIAMYQAKQKGRDSYQFFSANMNIKIIERLILESGMRRALELGEFFLNYQPQIDLESGMVIGFEALLRWNHPEQGLIPPSVFIPVAEESGLIIPLGELVLRMACGQNKAWQEAGFPPVKMGVNLSVRQFQQQNLLTNIEEILQETGLDPHYLELEITESCIMDNADENIKILRTLKDLGIHLSIDDFGTGYSSLSYLKILPIDRIKIDQGFVRDVITDPDDAAIAQAIIGMGHSMKLKVIAEGVETKEQLDFLCHHKCDEVQGYYFAKPMSAEEIYVFMKAKSIQSANM
ncbi:MAG: EAL domain-containing protein [Geobacteraceae bacterium]|nr:EAL domain-containing protein [Geobacteraceae bacterium]NTW79874.1 EAL domain-containing protein [Geobacteraceae bacterium]